MHTPNETIRKFLHRVLPLYDNTFNNVLPISECEITPNSNDFVIKFPLPENYSFSLNKLKTGNLTLSENNDITLTGLMFKYYYNDYTIEPTISNKFFLHIHKNSIDYKVDKGMIVYLSLPNIINQDYYSVYSVIRTSNKTTITILMQGGYFALKNELKNNPTKLIDVYTDYGNTVSGYNGLKKVKSITESGGVVSVTAEKDEHFNFSTDAVDFYCGFAKMHFNFNIKCVIPEEYRRFGIQEDAKAKRNALLISITRSRPSDKQIRFTNSKTVSNILTLNLHLFFYRPLFLDKSKGDRVNSAAILDGIQDKIYIVGKNIQKVLLAYENYAVNSYGLSSEGATTDVNSQQFNLLTDGTNDNNMCEARGVFDIHQDVHSIDKDLLNKESMLKGLQYQVNLQLYGN